MAISKIFCVVASLTCLPLGAAQLGAHKLLTTSRTKIAAVVVPGSIIACLFGHIANKNLQKTAVKQKSQQVQLINPPEFGTYDSER